MTAKTARKTRDRSLPALVADVALVAADTCAAIGDVSVSWWHEEVRAERAPKPAIQQPRFTRWRLADVLRFWTERAAMGIADTEAGERATSKAKKASAAAQLKRRANDGGHDQGDRHG